MKKITFLQYILLKEAQDSALSGMTETFSHYVFNQVNPDNKVADVLKLIAPGVLTLTFRAMGFGWISVLIGILASVFDVEIESILESIYNKIKELLRSDSVSEQNIDRVVESSMPAQVVESAYDPNLIKLAKSPLITKGAGLQILSKALKWGLKLILVSAGINLAGNVIKKVINKPNAFDDTMQHGQPVVGPDAAPITTPSTSLKPSSQYKDIKYNDASPWIVPLPNDRNSISNLLINFSKEVYPELASKESKIRNSPGFQTILDKITFYNQSHKGDDLVFIPKYLHSKKEIVDIFVDDVS